MRLSDHHWRTSESRGCTSRFQRVQAAQILRLNPWHHFNPMSSSYPSVCQVSSRYSCQHEHWTQGIYQVSPGSSPHKEPPGLFRDLSAYSQVSLFYFYGWVCQSLESDLSTILLQYRLPGDEYICRLGHRKFCCLFQDRFGYEASEILNQIDRWCLCRLLRLGGGSRRLHKWWNTVDILLDESGEVEYLTEKGHPTVVGLVVKSDFR